MTVRSTIRATLAAALLAGVGFAVTGTAGALTAPTPAAHALFVQTDAPTGNSVISYLRSPDGSLARAGVYRTGGLGAIAAGAVADPLASQGGLALAQGGHNLIAVNAGSNTLSVFKVNGTTLTLNQTISSIGSFPVSVAARGNLVAVLDAAGTGHVAEYQWINGRLVALASAVRSLGLTNDPDPNFLSSPGQVGYSPNGKFLIVTDKKSTNQYQVFSVGANGSLSANPTITNAQNAVPFAFNFSPEGYLVATEAATSSVTTYEINANGSLTELSSISDGQKALCWIASAKGYYFGSNAASANVSQFSVATTGAVNLVNAVAASTHAGTTDATASPDGNFLYVQSGAAGTIDSFAVNANGSLTPVATLWNIPVASEGIVAS